tara:strand:- start:278 stop:403 length:126 start_codon:yes stop_codon:yes gene_type:complete
LKNAEKTVLVVLGRAANFFPLAAEEFGPRLAACAFLAPDIS